jgi:hypothetical protein
VKHYLHNGNVYAYEIDGSQDAFVPAGATPISQAEADAIRTPAPSVPAIVTMRQARLALMGAGLLAQVEASIDALPSPQKEAARIEWDFSSEVHRNKAFVSTLAGALGLTDAQLDALFTQAATL